MEKHDKLKLVDGPRNLRGSQGGLPYSSQSQVDSRFPTKMLYIFLVSSKRVAHPTHKPNSVCVSTWDCKAAFVFEPIDLC
jgi:hypothetical protein